MDEGGVLEIHGESRLSWTKLASTLQRTPKAYERNIGDRPLGWRYGYEIREFSPQGELRNTFVARRQIPEMDVALKSFAGDSVVVINKYMGNRYDATHCELRKLFNSVLGIDSSIEDIEGYYQAYVLIVDIANPANFVEEVGKLAENGEYEGYRTDLAELSVGEFKFLAQAYSRTEDKKGLLDVFVEAYHEVCEQIQCLNISNSWIQI